MCVCVYVCVRVCVCVCVCMCVETVDIRSNVNESSKSSHCMVILKLFIKWSE